VTVCSWSHNFPPHPGGLEVIAEALAREFAAADGSSAVVSTCWNDAPRREVRDGVSIRRLPASHLLERLDVPYPIPFGPGVAAALADAARASAQLAHGSLYLTTLLGGRAARSGRAPLVITEHVGFVRYSSSLVNAVQHAAWATVGRRATRRADALVAYNARVRDWLERRTGKPVALIRNGVDLDRFSPRTASSRKELRSDLGLPVEGVLGLFVGRAAAKKNLGALLDARGPGFRLVCCGASERELPADVVDLGLVEHARMPQVYAGADFLVHLGVGEGFPVAIQEAAASGLPILLLWDDGYGETIPRDCVRALDDLGALGPALHELAGSGELRAKLGEAARSWAERSGSWRATAERYRQLFASCVDRRTAQRSERSP
jgi:glycosyltransferase involved in cell wall biosynthesis